MKVGWVVIGLWDCCVGWLIDWCWRLYDDVFVKWCWWFVVGVFCVGDFFGIKVCFLGCVGYFYFCVGFRDCFDLFWINVEYVVDVCVFDGVWNCCWWCDCDWWEYFWVLVVWEIVLLGCNWWNFRGFVFCCGFDFNNGDCIFFVIFCGWDYG